MLLQSRKSFRNRSKLSFTANHNERCPPKNAESGPGLAVWVAGSLGTHPQPLPALRGSTADLRAFAGDPSSLWQGGGLHE